ncbi:putative leucine-rich repeat-containing protein DDB_G0290503 isoform X2 [Maniola hyperantus]|uniref:putative leucine-rich repeat-containing protein DDB_G0290503 isoform X2 n=1 Tax=Aphantopus hyperantus TaxID=2795564 RepID=UPI0037496F91
MAHNKAKRTTVRDIPMLQSDSEVLEKMRHPPFSKPDPSSRNSHDLNSQSCMKNIKNIPDENGNSDPSNKNPDIVELLAQEAFQYQRLRRGKTRDHSTLKDNTHSENVTIRSSQLDKREFNRKRTRASDFTTTDDSTSAFIENTPVGEGSRTKNPDVVELLAQEAFQHKRLHLGKNRDHSTLKDNTHSGNVTIRSTQLDKREFNRKRTRASDFTTTDDSTSAFIENTPVGEGSRTKNPDVVELLAQEAFQHKRLHLGKNRDHSTLKDNTHSGNVTIRSTQLDKREFNRKRTRASDFTTTDDSTSAFIENTPVGEGSRTKNPDVVELLAQEAFQHKRLHLGKNRDHSTLKDNTHSGNVTIRSTQLDKREFNRKPTSASDFITTDDSTSAAVIERRTNRKTTPNLKENDKTMEGYKSRDSGFGQQFYDSETAGYISSHHFAENRRRNLNASPTLVKRKKKSNSESIATFNTEPHFFSAEVVGCLNFIVNEVCNNLQNTNIVEEERELPTGKAKEKTKTTPGIKIKFKHNKKQTKIFKKTNELETKSLDKVPPIEEKESELGSKNRHRILPGKKSLTDEGIDTPLNKRKRKLYSEKDDCTANLFDRITKTVENELKTVLVDKKHISKDSVYNVSSSSEDEIKRKKHVPRNKANSVEAKKTKRGRIKPHSNSNCKPIKVTRSKSKQMHKTLTAPKHTTDLVNERMRVANADALNMSLIIDSGKESNIDMEPAHKRPIMEIIPHEKQSQIVTARTDDSIQKNKTVIDTERGLTARSSSSDSTQERTLVVVLSRLDIHATKSLSTAGTSPITAHGIIDESPPQVEDIDETITRRSLETENFNESALDFYNKLTNDKSVRRSNKDINDKTPFVSIPRLSQKELDKHVNNNTRIYKSLISPISFSDVMFGKGAEGEALEAQSSGSNITDWFRRNERCAPTTADARAEVLAGVREKLNTTQQEIFRDMRNSIALVLAQIKSDMEQKEKRSNEELEQLGEKQAQELQLCQKRFNEEIEQLGEKQAQELQLCQKRFNEAIEQLLQKQAREQQLRRQQTRQSCEEDAKPSETRILDVIKEAFKKSQNLLKVLNDEI